ncbi:MAG: zinc ribbon domain-containing protein [Opitutaceae bacterium]|nr:zinc ribbon domain-containing protein [Cytophagales bacterium]
MYCRNCSNEVSEQAIACPKCGVPPKKGKNFCYQCANPTNPEAIICVNCGVSLSTSSNVSLATIDKRKYLSLWGRYPYSTYVVIILLSLLPFANITCNQTKVYTLTGFDLTVGKVRHYTKTVDLGMYGSYDKQKTETISNIYIQLFYVVIFTIIIILLAKIRRRFRYAQWGTLIGLALLLMFVVAVNSRMNDSPSTILNLSYGSGYWLTLLMLIFTFFIIFFYRKEFIKEEDIPLINDEVKAAPLGYSEPEIIIPVQQDIITQPSNETIFAEKRNTKKYMLFTIPVIAIAAITYFFVVEKTSNSATQTQQAAIDTTHIVNESDSLPNTSPIQSPTNSPITTPTATDISALDNSQGLTQDNGDSINNTNSGNASQAGKSSIPKLQYLIATNAGMIGFYNDGTMRYCPKCDFDESNIESMYMGEIYAKYILVKNEYFSAKHDGEDYHFPLYDSDNSGHIHMDWALFNYKWIRKP